jgi:hypothetical protein
VRPCHLVHENVRAADIEPNANAPPRSALTPTGDMNPPAAAASTGGADRAAAAPEYAPYPRLSPEDVAPPPPPPYHAATGTAPPPPYGGNPYVSSPAGGAATAPKSASLPRPKSGSVGRRFGGNLDRRLIFWGAFVVSCFRRYDGLGEGRAREDGEEVRRGGPEDREHHRQLLAAL